MFSFAMFIITIIIISYHYYYILLLLPLLLLYITAIVITIIILKYCFRIKIYNLTRCIKSSKTTNEKIKEK